MHAGYDAYAGYPQQQVNLASSLLIIRTVCPLLSFSHSNSRCTLWWGLWHHAGHNDYTDHSQQMDLAFSSGFSVTICLLIFQVSICGEHYCGGSRAAGHYAYGSQDQELGLPPSIPCDLASLPESLCNGCRKFGSADTPGLKSSLSQSEAIQSLDFCHMILYVFTYHNVMFMCIPIGK